MFDKQDLYTKLRVDMKEVLKIELAMRRSKIDDVKIMKALAEYIKIKLMEYQNE